LSIWQWIFSAIVIGLISLPFIGLLLTLSFRIYWYEREAHTRRMGDMIAQAVREVRAKNGPVRTGGDADP